MIAEMSSSVQGVKENVMEIFPSVEQKGNEVDQAVTEKQMKPGRIKVWDLSQKRDEKKQRRGNKKRQRKISPS